MSQSGCQRVSQGVSESVRVSVSQSGCQRVSDFVSGESVSQSVIGSVSESVRRQSIRSVQPKSQSGQSVQSRTCP